MNSETESRNANQEGLCRSIPRSGFYSEGFGQRSDKIGHILKAHSGCYMEKREWRSEGLVQGPQ